MKKIVHLFTLLLICVFSLGLQAQDILEVPSSIDGEFYGILNQVINGDTTDNGERKNLNRIYKLNRGEVYFLSGTIFANYPLRITADEADDSNPPPIVTSGVGPNGNIVGNDFFTCADDTFIDNIAIMGTPPTNIGQVNRVFFLIGEEATIRFNKVYFEWGQWIPIGVFAGDMDVEIRNCYFKNQNNTSDPFNGRVLDLRDFHTNKLVFVNNTMYNINSFMIRGEFNTIDTVLIEHNTCVNTLKWPIQWRYQSNVRIANNLFHNVHSYGETSDDRIGQDANNLNFGVYNIQPLPPNILEDLGIGEFDRSIDFTNNNWFFTSEVTDYWNNYSLDGEPFMNSRTMGMMNNSDYNNISNTGTTNIEPNFINEAGATELMVEFMIKKREGQGSLPWGFDADGDRRTLTWPIVENLAYTNEDLLTGGDNGFPIGDLNWYQDLAEQWEAEFLVSVNEVSYEENILHTKVFPNPAKEFVNIKYNLVKASNVQITLIDRIGNKLFEENIEQSIGEHTIKLNLEKLNLISGTYYYILNSNNSRNAGLIYYRN